MQGQTARGGPTHCWRVSPPRHGAGRESRHGSLRPRTLAVPSYRPPPQQGCRGMRQCVPGAGAGQPTAPRRDARRFLPARRGAGVPSKAQGPDKAPRGSWACGAAGAAGWQSPGPRRLLSGPRAAAGAPAPLPSPGSKGSISPPVGRRNIAETARPRGWAHTVKAWPGPCFFSRRARDVWPAGWSHRPKTAAAAKAPGRDACPLCVPAGPARGPADAGAHRPRRPEETQAGPRGQRGRSGIA